MQFICKPRAVIIVRTTNYICNIKNIQTELVRPWGKRRLVERESDRDHYNEQSENRMQASSDNVQADSPNMINTILYR